MEKKKGNKKGLENSSPNSGELGDLKHWGLILVRGDPGGNQKGRA